MADETARQEPIEGFDDIPGTTLFDAQRARQGYHVNQFCMSLMKADEPRGVQGRRGQVPAQVADDGRAARGHPRSATGAA